MQESGRDEAFLGLGRGAAESEGGGPGPPTNVSFLCHLSIFPIGLFHIGLFSFCLPPFGGLGGTGRGRGKRRGRGRGSPAMTARFYGCVDGLPVGDGKRQAVPEAVALRKEAAHKTVALRNPKAVALRKQVEPKTVVLRKWAAPKAVALCKQAAPTLWYQEGATYGGMCVVLSILLPHKNVCRNQVFGYSSHCVMYREKCKIMRRTTCFPTSDMMNIYRSALVKK